LRAGGLTRLVDAQVELSLHLVIHTPLEFNLTQDIDCFQTVRWCRQNGKIKPQPTQKLVGASTKEKKS
jgi:hypothetical protein